MKRNDQENEAAPPVWERISSEPQHEYASFSTRLDRVRSPEDGDTHEYDIIESADAVTVVALTRGGELVMVDQFRHGVRRAELEFAGGVIDPGESPVECGVRELQEETGFVGDAPELLGTLSLNASWQTTLVHVVRVRAAERRSEKELDDGEDTRVRVVPVEEAMRRVAEGSFCSSVAIAALALHLWGKDA
jgi:ADP-ribose pyrophosphatase